MEYYKIPKDVMDQWISENNHVSTDDLVRLLCNYKVGEPQDPIEIERKDVSTQVQTAKAVTLTAYLLQKTRLKATVRRLEKMVGQLASLVSDLSLDLLKTSCYTFSGDENASAELQSGKRNMDTVIEKAEKNRPTLTLEEQDKRMDEAHRYMKLLRPSSLSAVFAQVLAWREGPKTQEHKFSTLESYLTALSLGKPPTDSGERTLAPFLCRQCRVDQRVGSKKPPPPTNSDSAARGGPLPSVNSKKPTKRK